MSAEKLPTTHYPLPTKNTSKRILLKTKKQVYGDMLGNNPSLFCGEGFEFSELREYVYGDDVRKIDWKSTAKLGKPYVKVYKEERELNVVVVTLLGGSMYFGTARQKSETTAEIVALLGFWAVKNGDRFSHMLFTDRLIEATKPTKKHFGVHQSVEAILQTELIGKRSDYGGMVEMLKKRVRKKALLFVVGDFVGDFDFGAVAKKHDTVAIIVRDRFEEHPQAMGEVSLVDPSANVRIDSGVDESFVKHYRKKIVQNDEKLFQKLRKRGVRFAKVYTHESPAVALQKRLR